MPSTQFEEEKKMPWNAYKWEKQKNTDLLYEVGNDSESVPPYGSGKLGIDIILMKT